MAPKLKIFDKTRLQVLSTLVLLVHHSRVIQIHCQLNFSLSWWHHSFRGLLYPTWAGRQCGCFSIQATFLLPSLPRPYAMPSSIITYATLKAQVTANSIQKLVTDSFPVGEMPTSYCCNKPSQTVSAVSKALSPYLQLTSVKTSSSQTKKQHSEHEEGTLSFETGKLSLRNGQCSYSPLR